jgi:hypothetical protein
MMARYKERKVGKNIMLFGKDVEADSNSRSSIRSMFDGDMMIHGEILVCLSFLFRRAKRVRTQLTGRNALSTIPFSH